MGPSSFTLPSSRSHHGPTGLSDMRRIRKTVTFVGEVETLGPESPPTDGAGGGEERSRSESNEEDDDYVESRV